jgi:phage baseplate assembly protein W
MLDRSTIPYLHWQSALGFEVDSLGQIVHGLDDLEQAMATVINTEKGSVPDQPEKCVAIRRFIDRPPAIAIPNITREIWDGLTQWEPRIVVERVAITQVSFSHFRFPVFWYPRSDVARQIRMTELTYAA